MTRFPENQETAHGHAHVRRPGDPADAAASPTVHVDAIEVSQAVQNLAHAVPLIAGKRTYSRPRFVAEVPKSGGDVDIDAINDHIQQQLRIRGLESVTAVEAARWLDEAGQLKDSSSRPGKPLRDLLRERRITGQRQEANSRWFIDRAR